MKIKPKFGKSGFTLVELILAIFIIGIIVSVSFAFFVRPHGGDLNKTESLSPEQKLENAEHTIAKLKASIAKSERAAIETLHRFDDDDLLRDKVSIYGGSETQRVYLLNIPFYKVGVGPDFTIGNALAAFTRRIEGKEKIVDTIPFLITKNETSHIQGVLVTTDILPATTAEKTGQ